MEMTFYIPPVFLFGNKVRHNQEKKKAEYKTATETEIQIENRNIKRIAELEEENKKLNEKIKRLEFDVDAWHQLKLLLEGEIERLRGLQICGKTVAQWIEEDKKVVRE